MWRELAGYEPFDVNLAVKEGKLVFTVQKSTIVLRYIYKYIKIEGHNFTKNIHPGVYKGGTSTTSSSPSLGNRIPLS